jgi:Flp pilus assembly protein TadD
MNELEQQLQQAARLLQDKRIAEAEMLCRSVLARAPLHADALHLLGLVRKQAGSPADAEMLMRQSIQLQPKRADFHANLGNLLHAQKRSQEAYEVYRIAVGLDPRHALAHLGLARTLNDLEKFTQAETQCRILIRLRPKDAQAWSTLASALRGQARLNEAEDAYRRAVALQPQYAAAHHNLGALLAEMDRAEDALAELDRAHALGLMTREAALNRGHAFLKLYRLEDAEREYLAAIGLQPQDVDAHRSLARLRFMTGHAQFAGELLKALAQHPDAIGLHMLFVELMRDAGDIARAEEALRAIIVRWGNAPMLHSALSSLLMQSGRIEEAETQARLAAAGAPDHPAIVENLISVQLLRARPEEALAWIRKFRSRDPLEQRWIAYEATAARLLGDSLYEELYDYGALVRSYDVQPPKGWNSISEFNAELEVVLNARHRFAKHPLDQSLRHGSQTARSLLADSDPLIKAILKQFEEPLADYAAALESSETHPLASRNRGRPRIDKCWSVQLRKEGFHVNHIHPQGWISSAYYVGVPAETQDAAAASGWIKFGEPKLPIPGCSPEHQLQPRSGRLVLFPSYMWHGTTAIHGPEPRTTIAFDAVPEGERK